MDIPHISKNPTPSQINPISSTKSGPSVKVILIVLLLSIPVGFLLSRLTPAKSFQKTSASPATKTDTISTEYIQSKDEIQVGKIYGDSSAEFADTATGTIEKGSINGVGTHILEREGGVSQRASLTSSAVDLDLFVGRKVEIKGQTNASNKTGWLLDVGTVKILE